MAGGSSDEGSAYQAQQAKIEADKTSARARINALFGEGTGESVDPANFYTPGTPTTTNQLIHGSGDASDYYQDVTTSTPVFDQAAYDAAVAANSGGIAATKAAREGIYSSVRDNAYTAGKRGLDEGKDVANRNLKFELFAKGLNGGSEDVNQNALLGRTYDQGIIDLGAKADAAATDLRSADEQSRLGLLSAINQGTDATSALSSAANQLSNNSANATATAQGTTLGSLFDSAGLLYSKSQYSQGAQLGSSAYDKLVSGGSATLGTSATKKGASGTVTTSG